MPVVSKEGLTVKIVMGAAGDVKNATETPEPVTLLDVQINSGKSFEYLVPATWNGTIYLLSGTVTINFSADSVELNKNEAIAFGSASENENIKFTAGADSRFLFISGLPVTVN